MDLSYNRLTGHSSRVPTQQSALTTIVLLFRDSARLRKFTSYVDPSKREQSHWSVTLPPCSIMRLSLAYDDVAAAGTVPTFLLPALSELTLDANQLTGRLCYCIRLG